MIPAIQSRMPLLIFTLFFLVLACNQKSPDKEAQSTAAENLNRYCLVCHTSQNIPEENLIAPPLEAVKRRYLTEYPDRDTFILHMTSFLMHPDQEKALMFGAVRRFQVMPKQPVDSATVMQIAAFIYSRELDKPDWFEDHYLENHPEGSTDLPAYGELFSHLDQSMDLHLNDGVKWNVSPAIKDKIQGIQAYLSGLKSENSIEDYPVLSQALRSKLPMLPSEEDPAIQAYARYQDILEQKIAYLEQADSKEQGEFALLGIIKQVYLFDAYFQSTQ